MLHSLDGATLAVYFISWYVVTTQPPLCYTMCF